MKYLFTIILGVVTYTSSYASDIGDQFAQAIINRYQPTINTLSHHGWDHSNSIILHGFEKLYLSNKNPEYLEYIQRFVDAHVKLDGEINGLRTTLDGIHPGILCVFLFQQTEDAKYLKAALGMRKHLMGTEVSPSAFQKTPDGTFWHKNNKKYENVSSVDGLYMVQPFLARLAKLTNDQDLFDDIAAQILKVSERSFNIKAQLPYHAWHYDKSKPWAHPITGTSTQFWSRAAGWYGMALVDVLEVFPKQHKDYPKLTQLFSEFAQGVARTQHPKNGFWYQVLDAWNKPNNYPESSATGMLVYTLKKGVALGALDKSYEGNAKKGWAALKTKIGTYSDGGPSIHSFAPGMGSQNSYKSYVAIRPVSVPNNQKKQHAHGYIGILMAAAAME